MKYRIIGGNTLAETCDLDPSRYLYGQNDMPRPAEMPRLAARERSARRPTTFPNFMYQIAAVELDVCFEPMPER